ncbi:MAG: maleylpyruvate isomerase family mycothiol-dependent enzyme [Ilumatobacteraceae bacterium]
MTNLMPMIHAERQSLADDLQGLSSEQWMHATWCEKWSVQDLVGHLVAAANITAPHFFAGFVRTGFSFNKFVEGDLRQYAAGKPAEVLQRFQGIITSTRKPPGPAYVALGEVMVHGEDIRRPLGLVGAHPAEHLVTLADMYRKTGGPLRGKARSAGLKMAATDTEWSSGDGPEVSGPTMSLILAMVGRKGALSDLSGPGLDTLRTRC